MATFFKVADLAIKIPALPRPTLEELQSKFGWIREIQSDTSPTDAITMELGTVLLPSEEQINGAEYKRRIAIAPQLNICLGYQHASWLLEHQDEFPEFMAFLGEVYVDFLGLVVVPADDFRRFPCLRFPCLYQFSGRWELVWHLDEFGLLRSGRIAVSSKSR